MLNTLKYKLIDYPHLIAVFALPVYLVFSNTVINIWRLFFFQYAQLDLIGTYCNIENAPNGNAKFTAYVICIYFSKYIVIAGVSKWLSKNRNPFDFIITLLVADLFLMDGVGLFCYFTKDFFPLFKYFFSGGLTYILGRQLYLPLWFFPLLNFIFGILLTVFVLNKYMRFSKKEMVVHFVYLTTGVLVIVLVLEFILTCFV